MKLRDRLNLLVHASDGTATIEFSLLLPLLVVILVGTIDYAFFLEQKMSLTHGAAAGVAYATLPGKGGDSAGIHAAALAAMPTLQQTTIETNIFWTCAPGGSHVGSRSTCSDGRTPRQWVEVDLSVTPPAVFAFPGLDEVLPLHAAATTPVPWSP